MTDDNAFWPFSLRVYGAPGVEAECLSLQDGFGIDVNVLLFCAWLAVERGVALSIDDLQQGERAVGDWNERVVRPLRDARRAMKGLDGAEDMRAQIKRLELDAERLEQEMLDRFALQHWPVRGSAASREILQKNIDLFLRAHGAPGGEVAPALIAAAAGRL
jgi:uncharacterized protein (TIGR02444 family)